MSEASVIQKSIRPQTKDTLEEYFQKIGKQRRHIRALDVPLDVI